MRSIPTVKTNRTYEVLVRLYTQGTCMKLLVHWYPTRSAD